MRECGSVSQRPRAMSRRLRERGGTRGLTWCRGSGTIVPAGPVRRPWGYQVLEAVTGATGHLGNVLVSALRARGLRVRAVARAGSDCSCLPREDVEIVRADLLDSASLLRAFRGADRVFHAAGDVDFGIGRSNALHATNVGGTDNVLEACRATGVRRLVYVSSIEALDLAAARGEVTEEAGFQPERTILEYGRSKALASLRVLEAVRNGLDAVVLCPTGYVGPYDHRLSAMGRLVVDYVRRRIPVIVEGGFDFVDVRDVAEGLIRAADRGRSGETYILGGSYLTVASIMAALEARTGIPAPTFVLPSAVAAVFARFAERWYSLRGLPPRFTRGSVRLLSLGIHVSSDKARREIGYEAREFGRTLDDTLAWFAEKGMIELPGLVTTVSEG